MTFAALRYPDRSSQLCNAKCMMNPPSIHTYWLLKVNYTEYTHIVQVLELPGSCFACGADTVTRMHNTHIPFFKEVIIMSNACDVCGYRNSEIKPGGGFSEQGRDIVLKARSKCKLPTRKG